MLYLYIAVWLTGTPPKDYKLVTKVGPFETAQQCYAMGALLASDIQSKDEISNALGSCKDKEPTFLDMKSMWGMVCASLEKDDMCWFKSGKFQDPTGTQL